MINQTKQSWEVGEVVKVGFLTLRVVAKVPTPGNWLPDQYALHSLNGEPRFYRFIPHHGVTRCADLNEAMEIA